MTSLAPARRLAAAGAAVALVFAPVAAHAADAAPDTLTLGMSVDHEFAHSGETLTYTLTIANSGPTTAENVVVTDQIPDAIQPTNASNGGVIMPPGDIVEWPAMTIGAGDTLTLTMTAQINDGFTNTVINNTFTVAPVEGFTVVVTGACASADQTCAQTEVVSRDAAVEDAPTLAATGVEPSIQLLAGAGLLVVAGAFLLLRRLSVHSAR